MHARDAQVSLDADHKELLNQFARVQSETRSLEDELERATYRANKEVHKTTAAQKQADVEKLAIATAAEAEIATLKSRLGDKQKQFDTLSSAFIALQKKILMAHNTEKDSFQSASSLQVR